MDLSKAFEIINSIVANASMTRQDHMVAVQALELLKPAASKLLGPAERAIAKKEAVENERAD